MELVLASTSPRRIELLGAMDLEFRSVDPGIEEGGILGDSPAGTAMARAMAKVQAVASSVPKATVLAADTVVVLGQDILDKASDDGDVGSMLQRLSGNRHRVITAVAMATPGSDDPQVKIDVAHVTFRDLSETEMAWYVSTGEGVGKAGGYAIQGLGGMLVEALDGDRETVIGLPTTLVRDLLDG
jgi:septum formation protein